jgi:hypothetical protein
MLQILWFLAEDAITKLSARPSFDLGRAEKRSTQSHHGMGDGAEKGVFRAGMGVDGV